VPGFGQGQESISMITGTSNFDETPQVHCPICGGYYKADEPEKHDCQEDAQ
jgi:hypothetical protein